MKITLNELRNLIKSVIKEETQRMKELTVILNFKKSLIQFEDDFGDIFDKFEFEPYDDGTIEADFDGMQSSLSDYFRKGMSSNVNVTAKTISYEGNEIKELESNDNINSFNELIRFITDSSEEFDAFLASKPIIREETSKKTKKNSDTESYEEGVDKYKYFVYNLDDEKVESGYEYQGDAKDAASDYDNAKVFTIKQLEKMGIDVDALKTKWKNM